MGYLSAQGARPRHSCKILTVLWSGKMCTIPDSVIGKNPTNDCADEYKETTDIMGTLGIQQICISHLAQAAHPLYNSIKKSKCNIESGQKGSRNFGAGQDPCRTG